MELILTEDKRKVQIVGSGTVDFIKPAPFKFYDDLCSYQKLLLELFLKHLLIIEETMKDDVVLSTIEKINELCEIPITDVSELSLNDILCFYFTTTTDKNRYGQTEIPEEVWLDPSYLATINGMSFFMIGVEATKSLKKEKKEAS